MNFETPKTPGEIIIKATCEHFGLEVKDFTENRNIDRDSSYQRFICIYLIKEQTLLSFAKIGQFFVRTESAVKNGYHQISGLESIKDSRTIADLRKIKTLIDRFTNQKQQHSA